ncbi:MAG: hypothetical protein GY852_07435 [bacterium]|nr:hypothetical protein [bacterium]
MNGTVKQDRIVAAVSRLRETAIGHPMKWKRLGEDRIAALNQGQVPKVLAVGPRVVRGLSARYVNDTSYSGKPGKVFEVTTTKNGWLDEVGAGSVYYAIKHLGIRKVDLWTNEYETFRNAISSIREAGGGASIEVRKFNASGSQTTEIENADAAVVSCSDSRVQVHDMYDNVTVVSNAGNVLSSTAIEVLTEAVEKGVPILMILGHTKCGAVGAAVSKNAEPKLSEIVSVVGDNLVYDPTKDPEVMNALVSASILRGEHSPAYTSAELKRLQEMIRSGGVKVMATFFDLSTGEVREL